MAPYRDQLETVEIKAERPIDPKPRPNHQLYIEILRKMTPEQRLLKAFELSEFGKQLFLHGLRRRHPDLSEEEIKKYTWSDLINVTTGIIKTSYYRT